MKRLCACIPIFMISFCFCESNNINSPVQDEFNTEDRILTHNNLEREYTIIIPESYSQESSIPLIINFHGFGDVINTYMNNADMRELANSKKFLLVYPQGSSLEGSPHWNPCPVGNENKSSADDLGFISTMISEISLEYNIDYDRIYATGYSNGGMMAYGLAHFKSDLITAIASVSGAMLDCIDSDVHPMPILHLHGTNDEIIPYNGNSYYSSVQHTLDYWIEINNTSTIPSLETDESGNITVEHYVYTNGESSMSVEHYKYLGGGHVWFETPFKGEMTSELIWNFVSQFENSDVRTH